MDSFIDFYQLLSGGSNLATIGIFWLLWKVEKRLTIVEVEFNRMREENNVIKVKRTA